VKRAPNPAVGDRTGVTLRVSGKWQAQIYFAGKSRYIGVYKNAPTAVAAYDLARAKLEIMMQNAPKGETNEATFDKVRKAVKEEM
jgi:hypothetical protein